MKKSLAAAAVLLIAGFSLAKEKHPVVCFLSSVISDSANAVRPLVFDVLVRSEVDSSGLLRYVDVDRREEVLSELRDAKEQLTAKRLAKIGVDYVIGFGLERFGHVWRLGSRYSNAETEEGVFDHTDFTLLRSSDSTAGRNPLEVSLRRLIRASLRAFEVKLGLRTKSAADSSLPIILASIQVAEHSKGFIAFVRDTRDQFADAVFARTIDTMLRVPELVPFDERSRNALFAIADEFGIVNSGQVSERERQVLKSAGIPVYEELHVDTSSGYQELRLTVLVYSTAASSGDPVLTLTETLGGQNMVEVVHLASELFTRAAVSMIPSKGRATVKPGE